MRVVLAIALIVVGIPSVARAYRPFDQTDGDTAKVDTIELELGPIKLTRGDGHTVYDPGGVFNYGFSAGWELVVDYDAAIPLDAPGSTVIPTDVLVKHVLRAGCLQGLRGPSVALELGPLLPTLPSLSDEAGWSTAMMVSQRWTPVTVHVNALVEYTRDRALSSTGGAIIEGPDAWRVRPVAEGYVTRERDDDLYSGLVGAIWRYREHVVFDAAVRVIRDDREGTSSELRVGLTWVIPT